MPEAAGATSATRVPAMPSRGSCLAWAALCVVGAPACKKTAPPTEGAAAPSASASGRVASAGCRPVRPGSAFVIGKRDPNPAEGAEDLALPFAVEVGSAIARPKGFAVAALRAQGGGTGALVALVDDEASSGRLVDLGRTHGDVDPPRLASIGDRVIVAVPDNDAGSTTIKLAELSGSGGTESVTWGATLRTGRDDSTAFDLAAGKDRGVVVWDEWNKAAGHSTVQLSTFDAGALGNVTRPRTVSPKKRDAAAPKLTGRPGGFWLAWVAHAPLDAGAAADSGDGDRDGVARWLEVVPLDANGAPTAEPVAVTPRTGSVTTFDIAAAADGSALFAWRLGNELLQGKGSSASLGVVRADGTTAAHEIPDEDVGPGVPSLLVEVDSATKPRPVWLSLASVSDATRLGRVTDQASLAGTLAADDRIKNAEVLAAARGALLLGAPRGLAVELTVVRCEAP